MTEQFIKMTNEYIDNMSLSRDAQTARLKELSELRGLCLRGKKTSADKTYYCVRKESGNGHKYLGDDNNEEVRRIKELRYLYVYLERLNSNISLLGETIDRLQKTDYDSINDALPKTYRNPQLGNSFSDSRSEKWKENAVFTKSQYDIYRPEDLKVRVNDGAMVRSKSEAMIYNYLLSVDAAFIYELPMKIDGKLFVPDFTILSDVDTQKEIIIEHQGMMDSELYRNRFADKVYHYLRAGFVQGINIFYTFDDLNGGFDIIPIKNIVRNNVTRE